MTCTIHRQVQGGVDVLDTLDLLLLRATWSAHERYPSPLLIPTSRNWSLLKTHGLPSPYSISSGSIPGSIYGLYPRRELAKELTVMKTAFVLESKEITFTSSSWIQENLAHLNFTGTLTCPTLSSCSDCLLSLSSLKAWQHLIYWNLLSANLFFLPNLI